MRNRGIRGGAVGARCRDRRAEAAGVPGLRLGGCRRAGRRRAGRGQEGREARQPGEGAGGPAAAGRHHRASGTRGGPPTAARPTPTPTRTWTTPGRVAVVHNGIIENFAALRAELAERGHELASETDTEVVAHLLAEEFSVVRPTWPRRCGWCAGGWRARSRWSRCTPTSRTWWSAPAGTRRWWSASGRARTSWPPTSPRSSPTPATAIELGQDQVVELRRDGVTVTDFDGAPAEVRAYHVDWDASAAEKGGYDYFMLKEIAEQPKAVADTLLGRIDAAGRLTPRRDADPGRRAARGRQGRHRRLRDGVPRRDDRQVRHRALDADPLRGRAGQRVPLPRPDPGPRDPGHRDLASPARPWTP